MQLQRHIAGVQVTALSLLVTSCASNEDLSAGAPCAVTPPKTWSVSRQRLTEAELSLGRLAETRTGTSFKSEFRRSADATYAELEDADVACAMLLRTIACISQRGASDAQVAGLRDFLKETHSCQYVDEARLSIDNVVQTNVDEAALYHHSLAFDLFVRNAGDRPALLHMVKIWFDEHLRPDRAPADMQAVSAIYVVAVDAAGASVRGGDLDSPVRAYYPSPGSPVLIVESPIAQTLTARSTDRFRMKIVFSEDSELRGPLAQLRAEVHFNDQPPVSTKVLKLVEQKPCIKLKVNTAEGWKDRQICPEEWATDSEKTP